MTLVLFNLPEETPSGFSIRFGKVDIVLSSTVYVSVGNNRRRGTQS